MRSHFRVGRHLDCYPAPSGATRAGEKISENRLIQTAFVSLLQTFLRVRLVYFLETTLVENHENNTALKPRNPTRGSPLYHLRRLDHRQPSSAQALAAYRLSLAQCSLSHWLSDSRYRGIGVDVNRYAYHEQVVLELAFVLIRNSAVADRPRASWCYYPPNATLVCVFSNMKSAGGAVTSVGWQITLCDPIDKWRPVVLR